MNNLHALIEFMRAITFSKALGSSRLLSYCCCRLPVVARKAIAFSRKLSSNSNTIQPNTDLSIQTAMARFWSTVQTLTKFGSRRPRKPTPDATERNAIDVSVQPTSVFNQRQNSSEATVGFFDRSGTVDCTIVVPATTNISQLSLEAGEVP